MKKKKEDAVVKAMKRANRELEKQRRGADHPWVAVDRPHKNRKKYNRKDQKKELRRTLGSFDLSQFLTRVFLNSPFNFFSPWFCV